MRKFYFRYSFGILFLSFIINSYAQEEFSVRKCFVEAESYFLFEEYKDALPLFQRILREEPENCNVLYKIGICYLNEPYQKELSIKYLLKAAKNINPSYKLNNYKEQQAPPETYFYLGQAYRVNGQFDEALKYYELFKKNLNTGIFDVNIVNDEITACGNAKIMTKSPVYFRTRNAGNKINSRFEEINPIISGNGNTMVFTRSLQFYDAVFITNINEEGNWTEPYNLTSDFGLDGNSYSTGISYHGDEIFVYRSDDFDGNLYSSKLVNNKWQTLKRLNNNINTKYWESHASPSPDGKYLYFTSNRKGGYGGLDIYKAPRNENGGWGMAENLGPIINSSFNDDTPFISPDGAKLFFSSLGHGTMGGYDLFVAEKSDNIGWSKPVNMGFPFNTADDDLFFSPSPDPNVQGIMSIYDEPNTKGLKDIYLVYIYNQILPRTFTLLGKVLAPTPEMLLNERIKISLLDRQSGKLISSGKADSLGAYHLEAPQGEYQLIVEGEGIKPVSVPVELRLTQKNSEVNIPIISTQIAEPGEKAITVEVSTIPKLEIVGSEYIITDSVPVKIELSLNAGDDLVIETFVNGILKSKEEYLIAKNKFSYTYNPEPGRNTLVFSVRDKSNNQNQKEITIYYEPKAEESITAQKSANLPADIAEVAMLANGKIKEYLESLENIEYNNLGELYELLSVNSEENGFSNEELNELFSILLTQRNKDEFIQDCKNYDDLSIIYSKDTLIKKSDIPLSLLRKVKEQELDKLSLIDLNLINVIPNQSSLSQLTYILSFSDSKKDVESNQGVGDNKDNVYNTLNGFATEKEVTNSIELASTTQGLEQFIQNLLSSADEELKNILQKTNFDSLGIQNSIDLVEYLFKLVDEGKLSASQVIDNIEKANSESLQNLNKFKEALANAATGELKLSIQEIDLSKEEISNYTELINHLLNSSKTKGYGRAEVYDLLVNMIGVEDVNEFIDLLLKYASGDLKMVLTKINRNQFSKPIEIIQYLISEASNYNYTETDINNLLIRLLLDKGLDGWEIDQISYSQNYLNKSKIYTTVGVVALILIILIILFRRRKKKKENIENELNT